MQDPNTKTCAFCAETIKAAARLCPYCRSSQSKGAVHLIVAPALVWATVLLFMIGGASVIYRLVSPGRDFAPFRDQLKIVSSSVEFDRNENNPHVTAVGIVRNDSPYAWKDVQLEVRY